MFSCAGLDCEIRAPFFVLGMPHTDPTANELSLTQILQISLNFSFDGVKSHGGWQIGRGACRSTLSTLSTLSAPSTQISKAHTNYFC